MAITRGVRFILFFMAAAAAMSAAGVIIVYLLLARPPAVASNSVLWLSVPAQLDERPTDDFFGLFDRRDTVGSVVDALRKAKVDDRVTAVVLQPSPTVGLWAKVQEIRDAVIDFKASGKPIVAHVELGLGQAYYLATACDEIFLTPTSPLMLIGVATYEVFLRSALDKFGVEADMLAAGEYKTAINRFTETTWTPAHREVAASLNRDFYDQLIDGIADGRGMTPAHVRDVIDDGPFGPAGAVRAGLVDGLAYRDELLDRLAPAAPADAEVIDFAAYRRIDAARLGLDDGPLIAVIYAEGTINFGTSTVDVPGFGGVVGSQTTTEAIRDARDDPSVRAIVLRIDSPGGAAIAADIIWRELSLAREVKPLIASMSDLAASGGYYIAAPAHAIVAQPGTLTGSIGAFSGKFTAGGTFDILGVGVEEVTDGAQADLFSPVDRFSEAGRAAMQQQVDEIYDRFLDVVADGRGMTRAEADAVAQGRVWTGRQARARGLVDELGGLRRAIDLARAEAGIPADQEVTLVPYPGPRSMVEVLTGAARAQMRPGAPDWLLPPPARAAHAFLTRTGLDGSAGPLALMPDVRVR